MDLFTDYDALNKEKQIHSALLNIRTRYGANAMLKGTNFMDGATTIERNQQIGGHKA
jgi:DNA polymerase V